MRDAARQIDLSRAEVAHYLEAAILTLLVQPDPDARYTRDIRSWWPETYDPSDYPPEARSRLYEPTRQDIDRYLDDLNWLRVLARRDILVLILHALGVSYHQMAVRWGRTAETYRQRYWRAIAECQAEANRLLAGGAARPADYRPRELGRKRPNASRNGLRLRSMAR